MASPCKQIYVMQDSESKQCYRERECVCVESGVIMHMVGGVRLEHGWLADVQACFYTVA